MYNPVTADRIEGVTGWLRSHGDIEPVARAKAVGMLEGAVQRQALMLAFEKIFLLFGLLFLISIPLIMTLRWRRGQVRGGADVH